jgi:hypothetical protein
MIDQERTGDKKDFASMGKTTERIIAILREAQA